MDNRSNFSGQLGFILAAAASAVGLGNLWRFPYLAAKDGGGFFLLCYLILVLTFGFTLLITEISIGRKTRQGPLTAYARIHKKWKWVGIVACLVPTLILPYYCVIGGWVLKYLGSYATFNSTAATDGFFTGFITGYSPLVWFVAFFVIVAVVILTGVEKGIEKVSKILMPILCLLILIIAGFSLTLEHTDKVTGVTRTGLEGLKVYLIPNVSDLTFKQVLITIMDAVGQLFFSISVAMGIMITYGSYARPTANIGNAVNRIELFDTAIAFLAGLMIIPAIYTFNGMEGMAAGPSLMFISLPKVFTAMGSVGSVIGFIFFAVTALAAITSAMSVMEAIVSSFMDAFHFSRRRSSLVVSAYALIVGAIVCLGYNSLYFEVGLPNGSTGQILDILDFISNYVAMPIVALATCILIGWVVKPKVIEDEVTLQGKFGFPRRWLYMPMVKIVCPIILFIMLLQAFNCF